MEHKAYRKENKAKMRINKQTNSNQNTEEENNLIKNTLDYFLASTTIQKVETVSTDLSDHQPVIASIEITEQTKKIKLYTYYSKPKITREGILKLQESKWPENVDNKTRTIFQNRIKIRPVISIQSKANQIFRENIDWMEKELKLSDLRREDFKQFMVNLNENNNRDVKKFYQQLNAVVKYRTKGKIVKGIKIEDTIIYGKEKDRIIKTYHEQLFYTMRINTEVISNGIFNYK